jgi:hypothetical protein
MKIEYYIIYCNNLDDEPRIYLGQTTNLIERGRLHKYSSKRSEQLLYKVIRENGGWDCWTMENIESIECICERDALVRECELYDLITPSLNKNRPIRKDYNDPELKKKRNEAVRRCREKNREKNENKLKTIFDNTNKV